MSYEIRRGDVFFVERDPNSEIGAEQRAGRPAIVVSANMLNTSSDVVQMVYLTTRPKSDLPTHATIRSTGILSTAVCEQVHAVDVSRLGDWKCRCTQTEMEAVDQALRIGLGLEIEETVHDTKDANFWKEMYYSLLDKVLGKG